MGFPEFADVVFVNGPLAGAVRRLERELREYYIHTSPGGMVLNRIKYTLGAVAFNGRRYMVGVTGELPAEAVLFSMIANSRAEPLPPDLANQPQPDAAPPKPTASRPDGWYWVKKEVPNQGELNDWVPALWRGEFNSWSSASFSGYPDYHIRVGARLVNPDTQQEGQ